MLNNFKKNLIYYFSSLMGYLLFTLGYMFYFAKLDDKTIFLYIGTLFWPFLPIMYLGGLMFGMPITMFLKNLLLQWLIPMIMIFLLEYIIYKIFKPNFSN